MDQTNNQDINQQPTTQPADNGNQGSKKMFTQEEVNSIVRDRLARERAKNSPQEPTEEERRMNDITARENKLACREYVMEQGLPSQLLDVLDTSNHEEFKNKVAALSELFGYSGKPAAVSDVERELDEIKAKGLRANIAKELGLPSYMADRIIGDDENAMRADAQALLNIFYRIMGPDPSYTPSYSRVAPIGTGFKNSKHTPRRLDHFDY